jgi:hypothetical protein
MPRLAVSALAALALACGGKQPAPAPGAPAQQPAAPAAAPATAAAQGVTDTAAQDTMAGRTGLVREVFAYRSAGRDPLRSLLTSGDIRPLLEDLRLTTVVYDPRYPARSVAVLRDVSVGKRYDVRVDDELGRMRVVEIRPTEVVLTVEEFGQGRQVTLALAKKQEGIP